MIYLKEIDFFCERYLASWFDTKEQAIAWIKKSASLQPYRYEFVPNSCIRKMFGSDNWTGTKMVLEK
jgi:hypothetical protein